jgi:hypothetical protein
VNERLATLYREAAARIAARAAEFMVTFPEASVNECLMTAAFEEALIHGTPSEFVPVGLIGYSPLKDQRSN